MNTLKKIWIIDDDPAFQLITKRNISKTGAEVVTRIFADGLDALQGLQTEIASHGPKNTPDIILLDINMPVYDGWYFLKGYEHIPAALKKSIRLFICSSSIDPKDISRANANPDVCAFQEKPLSVDQLRSILA